MLTRISASRNRWAGTVSLVSLVLAGRAARADDVANPYLEGDGARFLRGFIHAHGTPNVETQMELLDYYRHDWDVVGVFGGYCMYGPLDGDGIHDFNGDGVVTGTDCYYRSLADGTIDTSRCVPKREGPRGRLVPLGMEAFFPDLSMSAADQGLGSVDLDRGESWDIHVPGEYVPIRWCEYAANGQHTNILSYPTGDMWRVRVGQPGFDPDNPSDFYLQNDYGNYNVAVDVDLAGGLVVWAHPLRDCAWLADPCEDRDWVLEGLFAWPEVMSQSYGQEILSYGAHTHIKVWDWVLSQGYRRYWGFGAPDHFLEYPGGGDPLAGGQELTADIGSHTAAIGDNVVITDDFSERGIVEALRRGSFYVTNGHPATGAVDFAEIRVDHEAVAVTVEATGASRIQWFGMQGELLQTDPSPVSTYRFSGSELYVRAVAEDEGRQALYPSAGNLRAFTQPFFRVVEPESLPVPRAVGPPALDGRLGEFGGSPSIDLQAGSATASLRLLWDEDALYVGAEVADSDLVVRQTGRDGELWDGDGIELLFDPEHDRTATPDADDRHFIVNAAGDLFDQSGAGATGDRGWQSGATVVVLRDGQVGDGAADEGYSIELAVPWADLSLAPGSGVTIGADVAVNEVGTEGAPVAVDWARLDAFAQPNRWGQLVLEDAPAPGHRDGGRDVDRDSGGALGRDAGPARRGTTSGCTCSFGRGASRPMLGLLALLAIRRCRGGRR